MPLLEGAIRPFLDDPVTPTPFEPPGQATVPPVIVSVGLKGGTKTFSTSGSSSQSYTMGQVNREQPGDSNAVADAAGGGDPNNTLSIHRVRCRNPNNSNMYADVVVVDAIGLKGPDGQMTAYKTSGEGVLPCIIDNTPDQDYGNVGDPGNCSRVSTIEQLVNPNDSTQILDVEVLQAFAFKGPDGETACFSIVSSKADSSINDPTGQVGSQDLGDSASRVLYVMEIDQLAQANGGSFSTNSEEQGYPTGAITDKNAFIDQTFAFATNGPNGQTQAFMIPIPNVSNIGQINDNTQYTTDPDTGAQVPPDNTDPNPYVVWPPKSQGPWLGPSAPINQGPLWWIEALRGQGNVLITLACVESVDSGTGTFFGSLESVVVCSSTEFFAQNFSNDLDGNGTFPPRFSPLTFQSPLVTIPDQWWTDTQGGDSPGTQFGEGTQFTNPRGGGSGAVYVFINANSLWTPGLGFSAPGTAGAQFSFVLAPQPGDHNPTSAYQLQIAVWNNPVTVEADGSGFLGSPSQSGGPVHTFTQSVGSYNFTTGQGQYTVVIDQSTGELRVSGTTPGGGTSGSYT